MMRSIQHTVTGRATGVLLGAAALVTGVAVPAQAAYEPGGTGCRQGPSGKACAHIEIDRATGNIRARGAGDADPSSGNVIVLDYTILEQRVTEKANPGQVTLTVLDREEGDVVSTDAPISQKPAGPVRELCDNSLIRVEYKATVKYYVRNTRGATPYAVTSDWRGGQC